MRNAVGFYWTLPVPWAGFKELPDDIEGAAKVSRTIRYQCELIRHYAKRENYELIQEKVFLEIDPDRGSQYVLDELRPLEKICLEQSAALLYVDFWTVQGWRGHETFRDWLEHTPIEAYAVPPDEFPIDGHSFEPHLHFAEWRKRQKEWTASKPERVARALDAAGPLRAAGRTYKAIAEELNAEGIISATGKPWSEDGIRDLLKKAAM